MWADSFQCFQCATHVNHAGCEQHGGEDDDLNEDGDNQARSEDEDDVEIENNEVDDNVSAHTHER